MMHRFSLDILKSRLPSWQQTDDKDTFYLAKSTAFAGLQTALNVFKEVAGKTGVPGLQEGVKALGVVLNAMQKTSQNAEDVESFTNRIEKLTEMLKRATEGNAPLPQPMLQRIDRLSETWIASGKDVQSIGSRRYLKRLINYDIDARAISGHLSVITWSVQTFMVESLLAIEFTLDDTLTLVERSAARTEEKLDDMHQDIQEIKMRQDIHGGLVPHAITARYDCNDKLRPCHEGTRTEILSMVHRWVEYGDVQSPRTDASEDKLQTARVFWINGPGSAGTGKSTIAYTVAKDLDAHKKLVGAVLCTFSRASFGCTPGRS